MGKLITGKLGNDHVNSEDIGLFQARIGGEGAYVMTGCECTMSSANNLHISKGALLVQGRFYIVDAAGEDIAIKNGSQGVKRNDLVVLRYTKDSSNQNIENMEFIVVDGVPVAGDPVDPEIAGGDILANDSSIVEIAFCRIQLDGISVGEPVMLFDSLPPLHQAWDSISHSATYSADEMPTGAYWIDGSPIYRRVVEFGGFSGPTIIHVGLGYTIKTLINAYGSAWYGTTLVAVPRAHKDEENDGISLQIDSCNTVTLRAGGQNVFQGAYIVVEYTR